MITKCPQTGNIEVIKTMFNTRRFHTTASQVPSLGSHIPGQQQDWGHIHWETDEIVVKGQYWGYPWMRLSHRHHGVLVWFQVNYNRWLGEMSMGAYTAEVTDKGKELRPAWAHSLGCEHLRFPNCSACCWDHDIDIRVVRLSEKIPIPGYSL